MRISLSEEVLNKVLNVLAAMPYSQVAGTIQEIQEDAKPIASGVVDAEPEREAS